MISSRSPYALLSIALILTCGCTDRHEAGEWDVSNHTGSPDTGIADANNSADTNSVERPHCGTGPTPATCQFEFEPKRCQVVRQEIQRTSTSGSHDDEHTFTWTYKCDDDGRMVRNERNRLPSGWRDRLTTRTFDGDGNLIRQQQ